MKYYSCFNFLTSIITANALGDYLFIKNHLIWFSFAIFFLTLNSLIVLIDLYRYARLKELLK